MAEQSETTTTAASPFNLHTADITIRTCDRVNFHAHKVILAIGSPWFNETLKLEQPESDTPGETLISVNEDSATFDALLRLLYPVADPSLKNNLPLVEAVLEAALKYEMEEAISLARAALQSYVEAEPLAVFRIACDLQVEEEAKLAAVAWKRQGRWSTSASSFDASMAGMTYTKEMANLSAGAYFRLLYFLRTNPDPEVNFSMPGNPAASATVPGESLVPEVDGMDGDFEDADVYLRPYDEADVPAHRLILCVASAKKLLASTHQETGPDGRIAYRVHANGQTLRMLVRLCYPFAKLPDDNLSRLDAVMRVAEEYEISKVKDAIKEHCVRHLPSHPLLIYFLAVKWGWSGEIRKACRLVAEQGVKDLYVPTMEHAFAHEYVQLLNFCHAYASSIALTVRRLNPSSCQWRKAITEESIIPTMVYLPLVEQSSQSHFCYACMQGYSNRNDCNCRSGEFSLLVRDSKALREFMENAVEKIELDLPALRL